MGKCSETQSSFGPLLHTGMINPHLEILDLDENINCLYYSIFNEQQLKNVFDPKGSSVTNLAVNFLIEINENHF